MDIRESLEEGLLRHEGVRGECEESFTGDPMPPSLLVPAKVLHVDRLTDLQLWGCLSQQEEIVSV